MVLYAGKLERKSVFYGFQHIVFVRTNHTPNIDTSQENTVKFETFSTRSLGLIEADFSIYSGDTCQVVLLNFGIDLLNFTSAA